MPFLTQAKILIPLFLISLSSSLFAQENQNLKRYFYMGDGQITLSGQKVRFRSPTGEYLEKGITRLNQLFKNPQEDPSLKMDLRFVEMLDYLQDQLKGGNYYLKSGYRSPKYNKGLRNKGKLAAQSSMHVEGAAADLILRGVPSQKVFDYVKSLDCCGIGFYHTAHFHLDTGPARYWDEKTSKTEDKTPQRNSKVIIQTQYDYYQAGEKVQLRLMRMTEFPIGIKKEAPFISQDSPEKIIPSELNQTETCQIIKDQIQARSLTTDIPKKIKKGRYQIQVEFCGDFDYPQMPKQIQSRSFEIR